MPLRKRYLTDSQLEKLRTDPLEAMKEQAADPRDVPIAAHGDAPNPPGVDINGNPVDPVESSDRTAPVRHDPLATVQPSGEWHSSYEQAVKR